MRSGKAAGALETVWEDKCKYEEAERRFYEHEAAQAAAAAPAPQLLAEAPAVNGPGQDTKDAGEAEGPDPGSRSDPRDNHEGRRPLQKRKRSPKGWLGRADLALVGLSADPVWVDTQPLSTRRSAAPARGWPTRPPRHRDCPPWPLAVPAPMAARWPATM
ncbi:elongation factor 1-delta [Tupaia chinensis]|uniref:elongation factor 1-delta n=1 Tax=Tupaia chinensis TaxID=246437 RepID=UPI000FFB9E8E|nr:elongation factor 1-delta [Tupaia chinensis]